MIPWFSKTEGNTYATLLHHPFLFGENLAGLRGSTAGHRRQEEAARPALLWVAGARRPEVEEALRPLMDIVRSLELESFILTKLTKPSIPVNLVGPQVSLPPRWVLASRGSINFLCVIRRHFLAAPGPSCQPLHVQYSSDGIRSLTTLTTLHREHQGGG